MSALDRLSPNGFVVLRPGLQFGASTQPWLFVEGLLGVVPQMVEHQVIKAVRGGRSFASSSIETPLHNDLQLYAGRPADLQIMACLRPAEQGGDSVLADMFGALDSDSPVTTRLLRDLTETVRRFPFISGSLERPTLSWLGDRLVFLHAPRAGAADPLFDSVAALATSAAVRVRLEAGEVLVADNHRVLHGRTAFEDDRRELHRYLVWLTAPRPSFARLSTLADAARNSAARAGASWALEREATLDQESRELDKEAARRLVITLRMIAGESPGALARKEGIPEPELYRMRDLLTSAGGRALASALRGYQRPNQK
ncbi:MAG: TauD/TfdA family dioxygenase [Polyangiaceae bacterium]